MKELLDKKTPLTLVDSRPAGRYAQDHLPGAVSIPDDVIKEKKAEVLPKEKDKPLIFYCGGITCGLSTNSAKIAKELGYSDVRVYHEGEPAWRKKGLPLYASNKFVTEGNIVLIDLRDAKKAEAGRIARSVSIPFANFKAKTDDIPVKANVILYGDSEQQALEAMKILSEEGYKKVALVAGGLEGWQKGGGQVVKGPVETKITWKRKPVPGEVSMADFKKAAAGQDPNAVIVDVRGKNEASEGKLKNATLMPLDELGKRVTELPKGKKVFVHCSTGQRAEIAVKEMKKNGVDAYFLIADMECKGENCTFSE
ncbi:MAG: hypothetical protein BWK76_07335 [Desulfobulbaceae bacterium A2]|nr:MAG: hypothetical protein BWK76_07335 [Desulfobulbaceae bacterium A2]